MYSLEIDFVIEAGKRHEFLQTARSLLAGDRDESSSAADVIFERITGIGRFVWAESFTSRRQLDARLHSATIHTLLGAIDVLGRVERMVVVEGEPRPEILRSELPSWAGLP